ncbi:MAG: serine protease [Chloroflexota bacterium]|nr:MAG: serine protease [Chloroflexota bacterium]
MSGESVFQQVSDGLADAVEAAGRSIVAVDGRRRMPASGFVWSADGVIVTADHVLERDDDVTVGLPDGTWRNASILGRDPGSDIAVLRADGEGFAPAALDDDARVGMLVVAVGRPGRDLGASLGIVSALGDASASHRGSAVGPWVRSDVEPLPGFSGGGLVSPAGRLVGMLTSHFGPGGFALRPPTLRRVVGDILSIGRVRRAFLGITSQPVQLPDSVRAAVGGTRESGLLVMGVQSDGPAASAGLMVGDILVALDDQPIADTRDLRALLRAESVGQTRVATIVRGGVVVRVSVTIGEAT